MKHLILPFLLASLLVAGNAAAAESSTLQKCEGLLSAYVRLKIDVEQAGLALNIQKGVTEICQKLIEAEKPKVEPVVEPPVEEPAK